MERFQEIDREVGHRNKLVHPNLRNNELAKLWLKKRLLNNTLSMGQFKLFELISMVTWAVSSSKASIIWLTMNATATVAYRLWASVSLTSASMSSNLVVGLSGSTPIQIV